MDVNEFKLLQSVGSHNVNPYLCRLALSHAPGQRSDRDRHLITKMLLSLRFFQLLPQLAVQGIADEIELISATANQCVIIQVSLSEIT